MSVTDLRLPGFGLPVGPSPVMKPAKPPKAFEPAVVEGRPLSEFDGTDAWIVAMERRQCASYPLRSHLIDYIEAEGFAFDGEEAEYRQGYNVLFDWVASISSAIGSLHTARSITAMFSEATVEVVSA